MNEQKVQTNGRNMERSSARANEQTNYKDETKRMEEQRESAGNRIMTSRRKEVHLKNFSQLRPLIKQPIGSQFVTMYLHME